MLVNRKTIGSPVSVAGRAVHTGEQTSVTFHPANAGNGTVFRRVDLPGSPEIPARIENISNDQLLRRTTLAADGATIHTTEHILSAAYALGITDMIVDVSGAEPPIMDGSSAPFAEIMAKAGIVELAESVEPTVIPHPFAFASNSTEISVLPSEHFEVTFFFSSGNPLLRHQRAHFRVTPETYTKEIAPARTFCFFDEIEPLRAAGLIRGGNLASAVVFGRKHILNPPLRFADEPVRHKILDFIGDLALLGRPVRGHFLVSRGGHQANAAFTLHLRKELGI